MAKPTPEETQALLAKGDALGAKASKETGIAYTPIAQSPATINSSVLQGSGTPIQLPKTTSTPTTSGLAMTTNGVASQAKIAATSEPPPQPQQTDWLQQYLQQSSAQKDELSQMRQSIQGDIAGQASQEAQFAKEEDLYKKKEAARVLDNQMDQMDKEYRDEIAAIKLNPEGKFGGALQADINKATDRYQNNRANVALSYKVAAGDYNDAAQIVNDKVTSLRNQNAQQLQAYQLTADAIYNDLTESEKLIVSSNLQKKQDDAKLVQDAYTTALSNASQNGAPASILAAIDDASRMPNATAATILAAAGTYGAKKQETWSEPYSLGGDIVQKNSVTGEIRTAVNVAAGGGGGGGLTPAQINSTVNSIAGAFDNEPIVKGYNTVQEGYQTISSIGVNTSSPADDIAFIYAFAKIMDPNSVVREGEYNTIQKYAQTWADNFGFKAKRVFSNTNFLTPDAKQKMLNALKPKVDTITSQYQNLQSEYQRQVQDAYEGKPREITDYSKAYDEKSSPVGNIVTAPDGTQIEIID